MSLPSNVPELAAPQQGAIDEAEISRCIESASALVHGFASRGAPAALEALLAAASEPLATSADRARQIAATVLQQTTTLDEEVARFLSMTSK
jgi:hypothetical protein